MDIRILGHDEAETSTPGITTLEALLDLDDLAQLRDEALRALEIERTIPVEARTETFEAGDETYIADFVKTRATNDTLEAYNIIPVAIPHVKVAGLTEKAPYSCRIEVHPRPDIGLKSLDPIDLTTHRVPKPGFRADDENAEFVDIETVLRVKMVDRLDAEIPESAMRALGREYRDAFEHELNKRGITSADYQAMHQLDDEQYDIMMTRRALNIAHWNYVLDAVFTGNDFKVTADDVRATFEADFPGYGEALFELHDLRNDLYLTVEKFRRAKALEWLRENVVK